MSLIKSRKHPTPTRLRTALASALLLPAVAAHAQAGGSQLPGLQVDAARESPYKAERSAYRFTPGAPRAFALTGNFKF
ncbi:hypothetical protein HWE04_13945 [Herbaspirillum sp. C7C2]|uniref:hypothetical protein n=1 Tax=Herbaspirillum sp. C7C2 TaxID=2736666 RepID=UPI001F519FE1|nr:hypothetical protein [Herbaspirillum sp. C7C2]MCI1014953.1 hypothetical protein [Herbaspirillum sp. C7C2]